MLHFTCDLCGQPLNDQRYVVQLEVFPAFDPDEITEADLDADHLQEVADILRDEELLGSASEQDEDTKEFRYDLCPKCHARFIKDPLASSRTRRMKFSEN